MQSTQEAVGYLGTPAEQIRYHYDISNEFYGLFVDSTRSYSSALWAEGDTLESAQERKIEYHIEQARAANARRVLDIGCGWGGMLRRLVTVHGVGHAVGLTLSEAQLEWIKGMNLPRVEVRLENWFDHKPDEPYDAAISVGAFEHFAGRLSRPERREAFRNFFGRVHGWLPPGGRLSLQTMAMGNAVRYSREAVEDATFVAEKIFPGSGLGTLPEIIGASEHLFDVLAIRFDEDHYVKTFEAWRDRLAANRDRAVELVGEEKTADYLRAIKLAAHYFGCHQVTLLRITFERPPQRLAPVPA
jgi:cyclopropane-fatty-acyl-phospholipid synthase